MDERQVVERSQKYQISEEMSERLINNFTYHEPKDDQVERYAYLRAACYALADTICAQTPPSREQSLALTALEDVSMWVNAAIARNE